MGATVSQITSLTIVYSTVYSDADQRKKLKLRVTGLCARNVPGTGEFPAQMANNAENVSIMRIPVIYLPPFFRIASLVQEKSCVTTTLVTVMLP